MSTRFSVIVPCFNDGETLREAVASVQEPEPVEIVVINDGSTEEPTLAALDQLSLLAEVTVINQPNSGLGAARATGLASSSAPFVFPLDADDLLLPGALTAMAAALDDDPTAAFCWGDYELFGSEHGYYRSPAEWLPWTLTWVNPYPVSSMFRRSALASTGGWSSTLRSYEDWDLWMRLADQGFRGIKVDAPVYKRRIHGDGRLLPQARQKHAELYAELKQRNPALFARRRQLRRLERPAAWKPLIFPVLFGARKAVPLRIEDNLKRLMMSRGRGLP